jgi:hypothetical protein
MNRDSTTPASTTGNLRSKQRTLLIVILVCFGFLVVAIAVLSQIGSSAYRVQIDALREKGEAVSLEELLDRRTPIPGEQNSALIIVALADKLKGIDHDHPGQRALPLIGRGELPGLGQPWPRETVVAINAYVEEQSELLDELDAIHELPTGQFEITAGPNGLTFATAMDMQSRPFSQLRHAAKLEALAALHDCFAGETNAALTRIETILNTSAPAANDPTLLGSLVSFAIDGLALNVTEQALATATASPKRLESLQQKLYEAEMRNAIRLGLRGERLLAVEMMTAIRAGKPVTIGGAAPPVPPILGRIGGGWIRHNQAKMLRLYNPVIEACENVEEAIDAAAQFDANTAALGSYYAMVNIVTPGIHRSVQLWGRRNAQLRCTRTAIAAERYRVAHDRWPETLATLTPDLIAKVPTDPFTGKPLRYIRTDTGITVYSVGEDEFDNEGYVSVESDLRKRAPDVGFRLLDPDRRGVTIVEEDSESPGE